MFIKSGQLERDIPIDVAPHQRLQMWNQIAEQLKKRTVIIEDPRFDGSFFRIDLLEQSFKIELADEDVLLTLSNPVAGDVHIGISVVEMIYVLKDIASFVAIKLYGYDQDCWSVLERFVDFIDNLTKEVLQFLDPVIVDKWILQLNILMSGIQKRDQIMIADILRFRMIQPFLN